MEAKDVLQFLNETPYVYKDMGRGVKIMLKTGDRSAPKSERVKLNIKKGRGGLDVSHPDGVFHFEWDAKNRKWAFPSL